VRLSRSHPRDGQIARNLAEQGLRSSEAWSGSDVARTRFTVAPKSLSTAWRRNPSLLRTKLCGSNYA
jgi:Tfp pilus assembly protein PilX